MYKLSAAHLFQDETLSLSDEIFISDVDKAKTKFVTILNRHHHNTSFWEVIRTLGGEIPRRKKQSRQKITRRVTKRSSINRRKPAVKCHVDLSKTRNPIVGDQCRLECAIRLVTTNTRKVDSSDEHGDRCNHCGKRRDHKSQCRSRCSH